MGRFQVIACSAVAVVISFGAQAQTILEEVIVTAQKREQNVQDVPISVSTLADERFDVLFEGGEDIRALATRVPGLYAESSNGRLAPRFYIRGLGNTDFDLAASQSVSIIVDEVVQENVLLKSFPLFDIAQVEVLRGPQGTLFGRNTPAGIVKLDTAKPTQDTQGKLSASVGSLGTLNVEAAVGGSIGSDALTGRVSVLYQNRDDWIDNGFTGQNDALGGHEEKAWRAQLQYEPSDNFRALFNLHGRDFEGTASVFRANIVGPTNELNDNFDRNVVLFDEGDNNPAMAESLGGSLRLDIGFGNGLTFTSITAHEQVNNFSLGDIDGGFGAVFLPESGPGFIPFPSQTKDGIDNLDQFTQEFRLASSGDERFNWQAGVFFFDSEFAITTTPFFVPPTTVSHSNETWALFGQGSYQLNDMVTLTGGIRYTDDEKDFAAFNAPIPTGPVSVSDDQVSWDFSALFAMSDEVNLFARIAQGFRAPTIQGRDVAFFGAPSTAQSETITSIEGGFKSTLADNRVRLNGSIYYYTIKDQQLSAIGGGGNFVQLVNADEGVGVGFDLDAEFLLSDNLLATVGVSYTDTEIKDDVLVAAPCGSGLCTVTDPLDTNGNAFIDGNSFPQAPQSMVNVTLRYGHPVSTGEVFFMTDWAIQGKTEFFLYNSEEFFSDGNTEGGLRAGYISDEHNYEIALFARNITDEENLKGAIDFNNLTGFVNEPRVVGLSFSTSFE